MVKGPRVLPGFIKFATQGIHLPSSLLISLRNIGRGNCWERCLKIIYISGRGKYKGKGNKKFGVNSLINW